MTTEKQIAANNRNAQHSTGPKTDAGRDASARNALKHGLSAEKYLLADEDPGDFERCHAALREIHQPANAIEDHLVFQITIGHWRLDRGFRAETDLFNDTPLSSLCLGQPGAVKTLTAYEGVNRKSLRHLEETLERYQAHRRARQTSSSTETPSAEAADIQQRSAAPPPALPENSLPTVADDAKSEIRKTKPISTSSSGTATLAPVEPIGTSRLDDACAAPLPGKITIAPSPPAPGPLCLDLNNWGASKPG